jgi:hypothetical protein
MHNTGPEVGVKAAWQTLKKEECYATCTSFEVISKRATGEVVLSLFVRVVDLMRFGKARPHHLPYTAELPPEARFGPYRTSHLSFRSILFVSSTLFSSTLSSVPTYLPGSCVEVMDRRILEQLSQLERGARDVQPHGRANMNGGYHTSQYHTDDVYDQQSRQYYPSDVSNRSRYDTFAGTPLSKHSL